MARIDEDDDYGPDYLGDMMLTFGFSGAPVAGKRSHFGHLESQDASVLRFAGHEFSYVTDVAGGTLVFERGIAVATPFRLLDRGTDAAFLADLRASGHRVFSGDRFNYVERRGRRDGQPAGEISDERYLADADRVGGGYAAAEFFV